MLTGFAIVAAPILGLNALLAFNTMTSAKREVREIASSALRLAESRLDSAATTLLMLGLNGVKGCGAQSHDAMLMAAQRTRYESEIAVLDVTGEPACAAMGQPRVVRRISPDHGTMNPEVALSVVAIGAESSQRLIRLQWRHADGTGLRVLVPGDEIFPTFLQSRLTAAFTAEAEMIDGAVIATKTTEGEVERDDVFASIPSVSASASSARYPFRIDVTASGGAIARANASLFTYANTTGLAFALFAGAIAALLSRRSDGPVKDIALGIRRGEFVPYYQPVVDIVSGRLVGCEVLARWAKPDGSVVPPGRFIALAEASGEIFPMTLAVMERARDDMAELYAERSHLKLGFNLFAGHFDDVSIVDDVERIFGNSSIHMTQLMFEVTERQPLPDIKRARLVIAKLQALGARVALDDVGTGHGGLSYLLKLGVDVMKMDKMFVDAIGTDRYSVAIVDSLVKLADDMNLDLIAEGVESFEQVEYLRGKGVRMAQGYVFAPPLPAASFRTLVEAMSPLQRRSGAEARGYVGAIRGGAGF